MKYLDITQKLEEIYKNLYIHSNSKRMHLSLIFQYDN